MQLVAGMGIATVTVESVYEELLARIPNGRRNEIVLTGGAQLLARRCGALRHAGARRAQRAASAVRVVNQGVTISSACSAGLAVWDRPDVGQLHRRFQEPSRSRRTRV